MCVLCVQNKSQNTCCSLHLHPLNIYRRSFHIDLTQSRNSFKMFHLNVWISLINFPGWALSAFTPSFQHTLTTLTNWRKPRSHTHEGHRIFLNCVQKFVTVLIKNVLILLNTWSILGLCLGLNFLLCFILLFLCKQVNSTFFKDWWIRLFSDLVNQWRLPLFFRKIYLQKCS